MEGFWRFLGFVVYCAACLAVLALIAMALPDVEREYSERYTAQQQQETLRVQAREATARVQAQQWGETARTLGGVLGGVLVAGVGGWAVVRWQEERSRRRGMTAQERVILAYIAAHGGRAGQLGGQAGVFLDASREFIPWRVAAAELASGFQPPVAAQPQQVTARRFLITGDTESWNPSPDDDW